MGVSITTVSLKSSKILCKAGIANKYLKGVSAGRRASQGKSLGEEQLSDENIQCTKALNDAAEQLENSIGALANLQFSDVELALIDNYAQEPGINLWALSSQG
ncbi:MAG: hypothetical protein V7784_10815 [Oceanospirillaceae bacterium]